MEIFYPDEAVDALVPGHKLKINRAQPTSEESYRREVANPLPLFDLQVFQERNRLLFFSWRDPVYHWSSECLFSLTQGLLPS